MIHTGQAVTGPKARLSRRGVLGLMAGAAFAAPGLLRARGPLFAEDFGTNHRPGLTDMSATLQRGLDALAGSGEALHLRPGVDYALGAMLKLPEGTGLEGNGATLLPRMYTTDITADRAAAGALMIDASGGPDPARPAEGLVLRNFRVRSDLADGQVCDGIRVFNSARPLIEGIDFEGRLFIMIRTGTLKGGTIRHVTARNSHYSSDFGGSITRKNAQITVLDVDEMRRKGISSEGLSIHAISGRDLYQSGAALSAVGVYQSDVVNSRGVGHRITDISGYNLGEVVDHFGTRATGGNFRGEQVVTTLKLVHGAQFNTFEGIWGRDEFFQTLIFAGTVSGETSHNVVSDVTSRGLDPDGRSSASYGTACVRFEGSRGGCRDNRVLGLLAEPGQAKNIVIAAGEGLADNLVEGISRLRDARLTNYGNVHAGCRVFETVSTDLEVFRSADAGPIPEGVETPVRFDAVQKDTKSEFDIRSGAWVCSVPGRYLVETGVGLGPGVKHVLRIVLSSPGRPARKPVEWTAEGQDSLRQVIDVRDGDRLHVAIVPDRSVRIEGGQTTYLRIWRGS
ncbi:hypothetical protein ATO6_22775 [Oceanicola sp. 22II-s10i]|uniref:hypothetical protein n=1 Tax=Oceanicola sp. 22II-s10i TaxID=1317116 RepID=UPI000B6F17E0|nr:hypothetical protein [Oceanicola sp. 22II-s10i]OWU82267.1 hypothetical protein ATO6_22775 [Oceanicola sp. 22II-s10i]